MLWSPRTTWTATNCSLSSPVTVNNHISAYSLGITLYGSCGYYFGTRGISVDISNDIRINTSKHFLSKFEIGWGDR